MSIERVAVVFDNQTRPETTGIYCLRALSELTRAIHVTPEDLPRIRPGEYDLILNIDDGLRYSLPPTLHPCAWWVIDTHLAPDWAEEKGQAFDWLFAAQKDGAERLSRQGLPTTWLPLACDPDIHRPHAVVKKWDVGFVGRIAPGIRQDLLALIQRHYPNSFIGQAYFDEFAQVYSASRTGFNRSVRNDINMRVFETLGCGTMLLTNDLRDNGQEELLKSGSHLATYRDADELLDKLQFFLRDDSARERIAKAGHAEVIARHTYRHRMQALLETIERDLTKTSIGGSEVSKREERLDPGWLDEVDIVIKTFLRPLALLQLLESLFAYYPGAHVTIADDGGIRQGADADNRRCCEFLSHHPQVNLIELPFAAGVVVGRNTLVERTRRPYLLLLDDDFCFTATTRIERLFSRLKTEADAGVVAGDCIDVIENHRERRRSGGTLKINGDTLIHETQDWHDHQRGECDYVPNFIMLRREVFNTVRWDVGLGGEHYDFLLQLLGSHWKVLQDESVQIEHYPLTSALPGYATFRNATLPAQQAFLAKWRLQRMIQDGKVILERNKESAVSTEIVPRPPKDDLYFEFPRTDVLELVPVEARRVLDIGCGGGRLGAQIRQRQGAVVVGLESNPKAAGLARRRLNEVREQDVERPDVDFPPGSFDCVICADVLEHLREPSPVLKKIRKWLTPNGCLIISIPNVRHHTVVAGLLAGNWTYESAGLLDADHVRFFTRREIEKLLYRNRFTVSESRPKPSPDYTEWLKQGRPGEVRMGNLQIAGMSPAEAEEFFVYQYLLVAHPDPGAGFPRKPADQSELLSQFFSSYPWPVRKPDVDLPKDNLGWFQEGSREILTNTLKPEMRLVVELGAWLGLSTRFIADRAPMATVITIDHWQGSPEHRARPDWAVMLPTLYETFLAMNWEYRNRILPLRTTCKAGLQLIHSAGLQPDLIFVDADHSYAAVLEDLETSHSLFPAAQIVGDDFDCDDVRRAVIEFAHQQNFQVETSAGTWRSWRLVPTAEPQAERDPGLTSIILVTFNQLAFTRECIDSIRLRTDEPYELICIDNGSTDGSAEYLQSLSGAQVILNPDNRGFPSAANQGLQIARGNQLLLLNNDTVVTTGWLRRMLAALHRSPEIGLVGPCSNYVSGPQQVAATYRDMGSLDGFAWDWGQQYAGQVRDLDRLIGFCLLFKREVLERIGLLDERFGIGCYEDDDYCRRALQAGYRCVVAVDSFVHHYGNRTFAGSGVDLQEVLDENRRKFDEKWQPQSQPVTPEIDAPTLNVPNINSTSNIKFEKDVVTVPKRPGPPRVKRAVGGGLLLTDEPLRLSLCMIVRDNENTIEPCLKSIQPWVDEIVVVDTGSKDRTPEICRYYGARVFEFPWIDDFSAARNVSLDHARGQWIFWMDSDDTISEECGRQLRALADSSHPDNVLGYVMQVHCPGIPDNGHADITVVDHIKLFPNRPELRFEHRIHEQILPAIRRLGGDVQFTDISVIHSGSDHSAAGRERKLARDFRLLNLDLKDRPDHPFVLFNLGMTHADAQQYDEAVRRLSRCLEVSHADESHVSKAYALLVSSLEHLGQSETAWTVCQRGRELFPDDKELLFRQAMLAHQSHRLSEAADLYHRVLAPTTARRFLSLDADLSGYKARHNLAIVYEDLEMLEQAEAQWRMIVLENPTVVAAKVGLAECLIKQNLIGDAKTTIAELESHPQTAAEGYRLLSKCLELQGDPDGALRGLRAGILRCGATAGLLQETARLEYSGGNLIAASNTLRQLTEMSPNDKSAWNNWGVVLSELQQRQQAESAFQRAKILSRSENDIQT